ncbi:MAG: hypothetical protein R3F62_12355 [Planctomycetota bacterium]
MQPLRGADAAPALQRIKDAQSSGKANESQRASRAPAASGQGQVETPERARVNKLVQQLVNLPEDRSDAIAAAKERLESGFFHSEEGLRATAERLLGSSD